MKENKKILNNKSSNLKLKKITKKKSMQEKGITLIALVVTIVILLILAGVTIATVTGDNGLFSKAKKATVEYEKEALKEEIRLAILDKQLENSGEITRRSIRRYFGTISEKLKKMRMIK